MEIQRLPTRHPRHRNQLEQHPLRCCSHGDGPNHLGPTLHLWVRDGVSLSGPWLQGFTVLNARLMGCFPCTLPALLEYKMKAG